MSERHASLRLASYRPLFALLLIAGTLNPSPATAGDAWCHAETVALNATTYRDLETSGEIALFHLAVPADGVLMLHASNAATELTQPRLVFLGDGCAGGNGYTVIDQTPAGLVLWVAEGSHFVEVSTEDPERPQSFFKLQTAFVAERDLWTKDIDPIDDDDVPGGGGLTAPGDSGRGCLTKDIDPIDDDDVPGGGGLADPGVMLVAVCGPGETDDHFDMPLCGTPLTADHGITGTLDSATDDDYFTFELAAQETVAIGVSTDGAAAAVLYDERGQRLESRSCSGACSMRIVRTLGAGRFDLRVASAGVVGSRYDVYVATLDR